MKFIVDAQLPRALCLLLSQNGHDCIHTLELPKRNATTDNEISALSIRESRVVISKDADFYDRYLVKVEPYKLIYITTGNISTKALLDLFEKNLQLIVDEISRNEVVEITKKSIITIF